MKLFSFLSINFCLILKINLVLTRCPKGTIEGLDSSFCYKFYGDPTDFWSANAKCQQYNGNLASITSTFLNETLLDIVGTNPTQVWIGGTKNFTWSWIDGNPFSFNSWAKGQPSLGNCTAIVPTQTTLNWYSNDCQNREPFLCEIPAIPDSCPTQATTLPSIKSPQCRNGYTYYSVWNSCYKFVSTALNFTAAENYCQNEGGHLTSVHSIDEDEFIDTLFHQNHDSWGIVFIGFYDYGTDLSPQLWSWTDGSPVTYTNWISSPKDYLGECAHLVTSQSIYNNGNRYWLNFWNCSVPLFFICKQNPICS